MRKVKVTMFVFVQVCHAVCFFVLQVFQKIILEKCHQQIQKKMTFLLI